MVITDQVELTDRQLEGAKLLADPHKKYLLFYGGSRSGKSFLSCYFIRHRARKYAGSKHLVVRYSFANAKKTIWLHTLLALLKDDEDQGLCQVNAAEGLAKYRNGSLIMLGGLEPSRIDSVLASEYGTIFITEANENRYQDVEILFSRLNDTSAAETGESIPLKLICDLNPTFDTNWTNVLFRRGIDPTSRQPKGNYSEYAYLHFKPEDNAVNLAAGYIESLKSLSPGHRKRFYEGEYGTYEGLVYRFSEEAHIVTDFKIPVHWARGRAIDFGFTHPFVCLWGAYDADNETLYIYREYSASGLTVRQHAAEIDRLTGFERIAFTVADHNAEDRATLRENGIQTIAADKQVLAGIDRLTELLRYGEGKRPNVRIFRSCVKLIEEFYSYRWRDTGVNLKDREVVKQNDDHLDALRYLCMQTFPHSNRVPGIAGRPVHNQRISFEEALIRRLDPTHGQM